jgi:hypothetical protein
MNLTTAAPATLHVTHQGLGGRTRIQRDCLRYIEHESLAVCEIDRQQAGTHTAEVLNQLLPNFSQYEVRPWLLTC